jgi:GxxExxY protein
MTENEISYVIRGCVFKVYNRYGAGMLESAYIAAMCEELRSAGLKVETELTLPMVYKDISIAKGYRLDMVVEDKVIVEIKSVEVLLDVHHKQVITYLKLSGHKLALLINFNVDDITEGIFRKVNGL